MEDGMYNKIGRIRFNGSCRCRGTYDVWQIRTLAIDEYIYRKYWNTYQAECRYGSKKGSSSVTDVIWDRGWWDNLVTPLTLAHRQALLRDLQSPNPIRTAKIKTVEKPTRLALVQRAIQRWDYLFDLFNNSFRNWHSWTGGARRWDGLDIIWAPTQFQSPRCYLRLP